MLPSILLLIFITILSTIESIYVGLIYSPFKKMIERIQQRPFTVRWEGFAVSYLSIFALIYYFILQPKRHIKDSLLLGILIYAMYGGINYATIHDWDWKVSVITALWGGTLFSLSAFIRRHVFGH